VRCDYNGQARVPHGRLLTRLHDHASRFQFNQRVVRLFLGHRHVNHQARRLLTIHEASSGRPAGGA